MRAFRGSNAISTARAHLKASFRVFPLALTILSALGTMIIPSCLRDPMTRRANTLAGFLSLWLYHHHFVYLYFIFMLYAPPLCHVEFNNLSVGQHQLLHMYRKTSHIKMSLEFRWTRKCVMEQDLSWCKQPFQSLENIFLTLCYNKTALHLPLASAKPVSKLHAVSSSVVR